MIDLGLSSILRRILGICSSRCVNNFTAQISAASAVNVKIDASQLSGRGLSDTNVGAISADAPKHEDGFSMIDDFSTFVPSCSAQI